MKFELVHKGHWRSAEGYGVFANTYDHITFTLFYGASLKAIGKRYKSLQNASIAAEKHYRKEITP